MAKPLCLLLNNLNDLTNRTLINHRNVLRALGVACVLMAPVSNLLAQAADSVQQPTRDDPWRHVEFNLISDVPGENVASVLDEPSYGFSLLWMKHTTGSLFDGGLDVGFQPLGGLDTTFTVDVGGEAREDDLVLRNQLAHAHYVLRTTLFPTKKVQPYAEVFGGIRGAFWRRSCALKAKARATSTRKFRARISISVTGTPAGFACNWGTARV